MQLAIPKGLYIVAVSGGVDSMTLLHLLVQKRHRIVVSQKSSVKDPNKIIADEQRLKTTDSTSLRLVVAHFNHGIRPDAAEDEKLVKAIAKKYKLPVEIGHGHLGPKTSEASARAARYKFLRSIKDKYNAKAIITAHHQDDLIETALLNLIRGTKRRGLTAIATNPQILRPLLYFSKAKIIRYARRQKLKWREDTTNQDPKYLRNYLRLSVIPRLTDKQRSELLKNLEQILKTNKQIDKKIAILSQYILEKNRVKRRAFIALPAKISQELVAFWLNNLKLGEVDKITVHRLETALKTGQSGEIHPIKGTHRLKLSKDFAHLV